MACSSAEEHRPVEENTPDIPVTLPESTVQVLDGIEPVACHEAPGGFALLNGLSQRMNQRIGSLIKVPLDMAAQP